MAKIGGIKTPKPLNRLSQNLALVITSGIWHSKPTFKSIAPVGFVFPGFVQCKWWNITLAWSYYLFM